MIALVFCNDLQYCPYIKRYIERLTLSNVDYCVLYWKRLKDGPTKTPSNYFYFDLPSRLSNGKLEKAFHFALFEKWVMDRLNDLCPDKVIVLSTLTAFVVRKWLQSHPGKYIFDIRDYAYENLKPFYIAEERFVKNSAFTAISSKGFEEFLPPHEYIIAHNFNRNEIDKKYSFCKKNGVISFVWNGMVRYFDYQKQYLDVLGNDERFNIIYHGDGPELDKFIAYCQTSDIKNVEFSGRYDNSQKSELLSNAQLLNNCYGFMKRAGGKVKYAISNRYYDGLIYHIPQVVEPEGYKPLQVLENGVGVNYYPDKNFSENIFKYYNSIDETQFNDACDETLLRVIQEDDTFIKYIDDFIA